MQLFSHLWTHKNAHRWQIHKHSLIKSHYLWTMSETPLFYFRKSLWFLWHFTNLIHWCIYKWLIMKQSHLHCLMMQIVRAHQMQWPTPDEPAVHANECSPCQCWPRWLWLSARGSLSWQLFYKFMFAFPPLPPHLCGLQNGLEMDSRSHWLSSQTREPRIMGDWVNQALEIRHTPTVLLRNRWLWSAFESDSFCAKGNYIISMCSLTVSWKDENNLCDVIRGWVYGYLHLRVSWIADSLP